MRLRATWSNAAALLAANDLLYAKRLAAVINPRAYGGWDRGRLARLVAHATIPSARSAAISASE
jgi:hypothetical protein